MHSYTIETERLILRPLCVDDYESVYQWVSDEDVARYMVYNTYTSKDDVITWLNSIQDEKEEIHFGFERKEDGKLIGSGSIGPWNKDSGFWMFGYNFRKDCWGFGYATEAAKAMIQFAKEQFGITRFCSSHVEPNKASGHVMEKCGLHFVRYGEFQKLDGTCKMRSMEYETGKKVIFLGSSVTYGSAAGGISFADYISERNGLTMVKEAVSGTTLVDMDNQSYVSRLKALDVSECDLFVCQLSTNDASQKLPIGDIGAALVEIIDYVKNKWNCQIAFYTNPYYDSEEYAAMVELLKDMSKKKDFVIMNMWDDEEVNRKISENRDYYMADPIHPTKEGYLEIITPFMEKSGLFN